MSDALSARAASELNRLAGDLRAVGVALSGGGDSLALLHLTKDWAKGRRVVAATVDHGLRAESAAEARFAAKAASAMGVAHEVLIWRRDDETGNLMAQARKARLHLLAQWAARQGLDAVLLGHTLDDQAETLLMRLGRGAGVDGLSGMSPARQAFDTLWLRPMLGLSRAALRDWLRARGVTWIDDPSNQNLDYERVRMRKALDMLGIPATALGLSAANLAMARGALQEFALRACENADARLGSLSLQQADFEHAPAEIRRRILVAALRWMTGSDYPARRDKILHALDAIATGARMTLEGVIVEPRGDRLMLMREPAAALRAAAGLPDATGLALWDDRWRLSGLAVGQQVRALGHAGLAGLDWRKAGLTHDEAAATPGIWDGARLVAAPIADQIGTAATTATVTAMPQRGLGHFRAMLFSH